MTYKGLSADEAAREVIFEQIESLDASGGIIVLDHKGYAAMEFNTSAMFRAYGNSAGERVVKIFPNAP